MKSTRLKAWFQLKKGLFYGRFFSSRFITMKVDNQTNTQSVLVRLLLKVAQMRN
jgi:hypothetical protein